MAKIDILSGFAWGIDELSIGEGDGIIRPRIVTAAASDPDTVRVLFDREMDFHPTHGTALDTQNYRITDADGYELVVLRVTQADLDAVDLLVETQTDERYYLQGSTDILDAYGAALDPAFSEAEFDGIPRAFRSYSDGYFFVGLDTGIQLEDAPLPDPDYDPPVLQNQDPLPGETDVLPDRNIELEIVDTGSGVNADSVVLKVDGVTAWTGRASQPGFSVTETPIADGYRYVIDPDSNLPGFKWIVIGVYAEDINPSGPPTPNVLDTSYQFRTEDINAPFLINLSPDEGTVGNPKDGYVSLDVVDSEARLLGSSIVVHVDGYLAFDGSTVTFYAPFDDPGSSITQGIYDGYYGYRLILDRTSDFPSYDLVTVRVQAEDVDTNALDRTYSFRIEDYEAPFLQNQDPLPYQINVDLDTDIELEIIDTGSGVDADSVVLSVDGSLAWSGRTAQPGFAVTETPITDGYRYLINPDTDFPGFHWVVVDAYATDFNPGLPRNVLDESYQFRTKDVNAPFLVNLHPDEGTTRNPRDGYVALDVVDSEGTIIGTSITVSVDGYVAFDGTFHAPFDSPWSSFTPGSYDGYDGYRLILERTSDFPSYDLVTVRAEAEDASGIPLDRTYSFRIEDYEAPVFANFDPEPGEEDVDENILVRIDIYDAGSGVDTSTLRVRIDGHLAYDGYGAGFLSPFDGPGSELTGPMPIPPDGYDGYHFVADATNAYPSAARIHVEVEVEDNEGN